MSNPACEPTPHPVSGSPPDVPSTLVPPTAAGDEPQPAAPGSMLDKFRIISVLGRGSTGIIYEAEDTVLQRRVAIRHLLGAGAHAGEQFAAGVAAIARLTHPNIVAIYETGLFENGSPYLASEFVGGGNAADRLAVVGR